MIDIPYCQQTQQTISSYEDAIAIIFFVDLTTYDQLPCSDDANTSLQSALSLFETLLNSTALDRITFILFLNKVDIFKQKILVSPLNHHFPDYSGGGDFRAAISYILDQFINLSRDDMRQIYTHVTCSLDKTLMRFVMAACNGEFTFPPILV